MSEEDELLMQRYILALDCVEHCRTCIKDDNDEFVLRGLDIIERQLKILQPKPNPMNEMLERVARVMCANSFDGHDPNELVTHKPPPEEFQNAAALGSEESKDEYWIDDPARASDILFSWRRWRLYVPQAREVLQALRNPTEEMVHAAYKADLDIYWSYMSDDRPGGAADVWQAMIDAALRDPTDKTQT